MDNGGQRDHGRHRMDYFKGVHIPWTMMPQYQINEANAIFMNKKIMHIMAEKDAALEELEKAIAEKNAALEERNEAFKLRDEAIAARDTTLRERDSAIAALRFHENSMNGILGYGVQRGTKRMHHPPNYHLAFTAEVPISTTSPEAVKSRQAKRARGKRGVPSKVSKPLKKGKKVGEDLNREVTANGSQAEWDVQDLDLINQIDFDDSTVATPVCSCTGVHRQCYKWGNGGWQSSCCTTTLSTYPLPQMPNRRHARMGGRKMSGSVFTKLLTRVAADGHDLSIPLDLKHYWAKHGTNRYITIK